MRGVALIVIVLGLTAVAAAQEVGDGATTPAIAVEPKPSGPFRKLFVTFGRDLKRLPSRDTARLLVNGTVWRWPLTHWTKWRRWAPRRRWC